MIQYRNAMEGLAPAPAHRAKPRKLPPAHTPMVYFMKAGQRVKIGYTTGLKKRVADLQTAIADRIIVLLTIPGDQTLERLLHEKFAKYRLQGEWFDAGPEITLFINRERTIRQRKMANFKVRSG